MWLVIGAVAAAVAWDPGFGLGGAWIPEVDVAGFALNGHARWDGPTTGLRVTPMIVGAVGPEFWCAGGLGTAQGRVFWSRHLGTSIGAGGGYLVTTYADGSGAANTPRLTLLVDPLLLRLGAHQDVELTLALMVNSWPGQPAIPMAFVDLAWFPGAGR